MQQAGTFMWEDDTHVTAVKTMHISIASYIKYKEMWVAGLSQVRNVLLYTHKS
jgi:hypothetical protein